MGVDMETVGSGFQFTAPAPSVFANAKKGLEGFRPPERHASMADEIAAATSLDEIFQAFNLVVLRDANGTPNGAAAYELARYRAPEPLLNAIADDLAPGSWYALN